MPGRERALIVGAGAGLSAALARRAARDGMELVLAARDTGKLGTLAAETGATTVACDASRAEEVDRLFAAVDAGGEGRGPDALLDPEAIAESYFHLHRQQRSAWAWEIELRPWVETF